MFEVVAIVSDIGQLGTVLNPFRTSTDLYSSSSVQLSVQLQEMHCLGYLESKGG